MSEVKQDSFFTELIKFVLPALVIVLILRFFVAQPFIVSGASMDPTFSNGQYLIVDELSYRLESPQRGDVIIFRYPRDPSQFFIKRIIGLPNETVQISNNSVTIIKPDGTEFSLDEGYVKNLGNGASQKLTLSDKDYFVMGDNRPESSDSRIWGSLPSQNIVGRALIRLLPITSVSIFPGKVQVGSLQD